MIGEGWSGLYVNLLWYPNWCPLSLTTTKRTTDRFFPLCSLSTIISSNFYTWSLNYYFVARATNGPCFSKETRLLFNMKSLLNVSLTTHQTRLLKQDYLHFKKIRIFLKPRPPAHRGPRPHVWRPTLIFIFFILARHAVFLGCCDWILSESTCLVLRINLLHRWYSVPDCR